MKTFKKIFLQAKNLLFPENCALCESALIGSDEIRLGLCRDCVLMIDSVAADNGKCIVCGKPLISEEETCLSCRNARRSYDRLWALFPYTGKYRKLLTAYKFGKKLPVADFFAEKIAEVINNEPLLRNAVIVPVPPRPGKIKEAGWDQVDYLVKRLKKYLPGVVVSRCLKRGKSKAQKQLNRSQRLENLKGRIVINGDTPDVALVIDDVMTTGSTMEVCSNVLKEGGAEKVFGICLFYD
ncbi:double zinc ribbon domain-containing protein [Treponema sp. R8-4-B8]